MNNERPASLFLSHHLVITLLYYAHYKRDNYVYHCTTFPPGRPFAKMGPYLRKSMLIALARKAGQAGHLNQAAEATITAAAEPTINDDQEPNLSRKERRQK